MIHFNLCEHLNFDKIICNKNFSYEPELFPALLISKWKSSHVTLFPNGSGIVTGIKNLSHAFSIIKELLSVLRSGEMRRRQRQDVCFRR